MKTKTIKSIGGFETHKKTVGGFNMLQRVHVFPNGIVKIEDYMAVPTKEAHYITKNDNYDYVKVKENFGLTVFSKSYTVRFETLKSITFNVQNLLAKEGCKLSDLV